MSAIFCGLAVLCLVWAALSFLTSAVSEDGDATPSPWWWVYALGAIAFAMAAFLG